MTKQEERIKELEEALESLLDVQEESCRFVRGCCQAHHDLTGDGSCYVGKAIEVLKKGTN